MEHSWVDNPEELAAANDAANAVGRREQEEVDVPPEAEAGDGAAPAPATAGPGIQQASPE